MKTLDNNSGTVHVWGTLLLILAFIGAGYLYNGYKERRLASDMPKVMAAYEVFLDDSIKDPEDKAKLKQALKIIAELAYKYNPTGINLETVKQIERQRLQLESSQTGGVK